MAHRLHTAIIALQELHREAVARERATAWHAVARPVEAIGDKLAALTDFDRGETRAERG